MAQKKKKEKKIRTNHTREGKGRQAARQIEAEQEEGREKKRQETPGRERNLSITAGLCGVNLHALPWPILELC
jgi:hypothetical protein